MAHKVVNGRVDFAGACHIVRIIYDEDAEAIHHFIAPKMTSSGQVIYGYDHISGQQDILQSIIPWEVDPGNIEDCLGCMMKNWSEIFSDIIDKFSAGIVLFSKIGAIRVLGKAGALWKNAIAAIAGSMDVFDDIQSQTPGLSGNGRAAGILKHAQAATKWLSRAGWMFSALAVIGDTYTTWVDTKDWKATLSEAIQGTIRVVVMAAAAYAAGKLITALAVAAVAAGAPAVAVVVGIALAVAAVAWGISYLWEYFELGEHLKNVVDQALGAIIRWWQFIRDLFNDAKQKLQEAREQRAAQQQRNARQPRNLSGKAEQMQQNVANWNTDAHTDPDEWAQRFF